MEENIPDVLSDQIDDPNLPDGGSIGSLDCANVDYDDPHLYRPHAFALRHGDDGAQIAYGELHWRVDTFTLEFTQSTVAVTAHPDHSHAPHNDHKHTQATHTHPITMDEHSGHTGTTGIGTTTGGGGTYQHDHGGNTQSNTTDHTSGVKSTSSSNTSSVTAEDGVLGHSGVKDVSDGTTTAPSGVLNHTVTGLEGAGNVITYCDGASQDPISNINVQIPKVDAEDGPAMEATVHGQGQDDPYHQLSSYGDVYLVWVVNLENAGTEVENAGSKSGNPQEIRFRDNNGDYYNEQKDSY